MLLLRYRSCESEWLDCIAEDEEYLRKSNFYKKCEIVTEKAKFFGNASAKNILENVSNNQCFESRRCEDIQLAPGEEPFVGYDPDGDCVCPKLEETLPSYYKIPRTRFRRQTRERYFVKVGQKACRVITSRRGRRIRRSDKQVGRRSTSYTRVRRFAYVVMPEDICNSDDSFTDPACEFR